MESGWECEGDRGAREGAEDADEFVDLRVYQHREDDREGDEHGPRHVLRPLPFPRLRPVGVQRILHDYVRGIEHQRVAEEEVEAEENDHCVLEWPWAVVVKLLGYYRLNTSLPDVGAVEAEGDVQRGDEKDHGGHDAEVSLRVLCHLLYG